MTAVPLPGHQDPEPRCGVDPATITAPARRAPVRETPLPTTGTYPPLWAVLGAHGGAGTSTLAQWWAPAADAGPAWPANARTTQRVVIAARLCIPGLTAAAERLREWHAGLTPAGVTVLGVVLTAARPGKAPAAVRRYRGIVAALAECMYDISWHDDLLVRELAELAEYTPFDPIGGRRSPLTEAVPVDVHDAGADIAGRLTTTRTHLATPADSEAQP